MTVPERCAEKMNLLAALALFVIMVALAAIPSASVALVVARSATLGVRNGAAVVTGIVIGDLVFVSLAILGMSVLAETMGAFFAIFKCLGGAYLIWLGIGLLRDKGEIPQQPNDALCGSTVLTSLASGLFLTLGDIKGILFYASLLPTFVDLANLTIGSISVIVTITIFAVGGVKLTYAFAAHRIVSRLQRRQAQNYARLTAGGLMVGTGVYLATKA